jgi:hypothetical protein
MITSLLALKKHFNHPHSFGIRSRSPHIQQTSASLLRVLGYVPPNEIKMPL